MNEAIKEALEDLSKQPRFSSGMSATDYLSLDLILKRLYLAGKIEGIKSL
jgi:hypothetical protein